MRTRSINLALALTTLALAVGCEHDPQPKERPHDITPGAVWAGDANGGAYFDCSAGGAANQCTVWNDGTGTVMNSGRFVLSKQNRGATTAELHYAGTDGKNIFLANGLTLTPSK